MLLHPSSCWYLYLWLDFEGIVSASANLLQSHVVRLYVLAQLLIELLGV